MRHPLCWVWSTLTLIPTQELVDNEQAQAQAIAEIGRLRDVLQGEANIPEPAVAGEAACQTQTCVLLGLRLAQLHDV